MLDLQDFSGQGTALVGMLNVFMESKGIVRPEKWREFCCETVPLLWMKKYTWTNDETFNGRIRLAHYGPTDLEDQCVTWRIKAGTQLVCKGVSGKVRVPTGTVTEIDLFCADLRSIREARKLQVTLALKGTHFRNSYDIWVYPAQRLTAASDKIVVARSFSRKVQTDLRAGKRVLLIPKIDKIKQSVGGAFQTSFWCWPMFRTAALQAGVEVAPGTLGCLCDPEHPLFEGFPTDSHGDWQWWHLLKHSRPLILDSTTKEYRPILQMIDNFARNHKLGLICEAKVGKGKLLICSIDLLSLQQHPEAKQLLYCLQDYMGSSAFKPAFGLSPQTIGAIV